MGNTPFPLRALRAFAVHSVSRTLRQHAQAHGEVEAHVFLDDRGVLDRAGEVVDEFLNDLGMFMGIASHHIADLCTPVHVGHKLDFKKVGAKSARRFHGKVERDIGRLAKRVSLQLHPPKIVEFSRDFFWGIAKEAYDSTFLKLEAIYSDNDEDGLLEMTSIAVTSAVGHTRDVWHTVFTETDMTSTKWSSGSSS